MTAAPVPVAVCQVDLVVADPDGNRHRALAAASEAADRGARLAVLPELVNSGYVFGSVAEARSLAEPLDGPTVTEATALARERGLVLVLGLAELDDEGRLRNSSVILDRTGVLAVYRKVHLWDQERDYFLPGDRPPPVVRTEVGAVATMVCYDVEFPEWVRLAALAGAQLLAVPTNWPDATRSGPGRERGGRPVEALLAQAGAAANRMVVAVADRSGTERGQVWAGASLVVGADGQVLAEAEPAGAAQVLVVDCDLDGARDKRTSARNDALGDRRPDLYEGLLAT